MTAQQPNVGLEPDQEKQYHHGQRDQTEKSACLRAVSKQRGRTDQLFQTMRADYNTGGKAPQRGRQFPATEERTTQPGSEDQQPELPNET